MCVGMVSVNGSCYRLHKRAGLKDGVAAERGACNGSMRASAGCDQLQADRSKAAQLVRIPVTVSFQGNTCAL